MRKKLRFEGLERRDLKTTLGIETPGDEGPTRDDDDVFWEWSGPMIYSQSADASTDDLGIETGSDEALVNDGFYDVANEIDTTAD